jgi:hypothetical protein
LEIGIVIVYLATLLSAIETKELQTSNTPDLCCAAMSRQKDHMNGAAEEVVSVN